ncbi:MAG: tRNA (N6-isopentenyl adenosine(37)-C2)-methylthiotransferase MiaB [Desulfobacteraceae bacterium]|nr:tRNA (N6-isopentenyl adenosine(37)-C2)-methylthiotransferase MiaB [Desulfobacteraceae bacterium]
MKNKYLYINTMGCQMNVYDSSQIQNHLAPLGYKPTKELSQADLIIVNTCTIRAKAEQKAFSFLGRLAPLKKANPQLIVAMGGCVAQQEGKRVLSRMPYVDLVFGTQAIARLPKLIRRIANERCRLVDTELSLELKPEDIIAGPFPKSDTSAFITIMRGCDNYCTYCVVPYVRGRESSRRPEDIVTEIRQLTDKAVREVTLLGQNVNSYGQKEGLCTFDQLLERINDIDALERIRFTTCHPKDLSRPLMESFNRLGKLCQHIHLPVQSGSDAILKRMNRHYTRQQYLDKIVQLRQTCPDIAISSDIIAGFPGETEADFLETVSLIKEVGFDGLFAFIYSDRPNAPSVRFDGKISEQVKKQRLQTVLKIQEQVSRQKNEALVGTMQQILIDGPSRSDGVKDNSNMAIPGGTGLQWCGRTKSNKIVHFKTQIDLDSGNQILTGSLMDIMIEKALPHSLWGRQA